MRDYKLLGNSSLSGCRALLPDLIKFAYIPQSEHRIHADSRPHKGKERAPSPDYSGYMSATSSGNVGGALEDDEHVLVLDFAEMNKSRGPKQDTSV